MEKFGSHTTSPPGVPSNAPLIVSGLNDTSNRGQAVRPASFRVAAYNIERGRHLDTIIELWKRSPARLNDVILVSEADWGMARSANRHVAQEFAQSIGYSWAYAVEFHELTKGNRRERRIPGENREALHGNAILSRYPLCNPTAIRLPSFVNYPKRFMARVGSRVAITADVELGSRYATVVSTHLEAHSSPQERLAQMRAILGGIKVFDKGQPIILGGDMNTSGLDLHRLGRSLLRRPSVLVNGQRIEVLERLEPMFTALRDEGYEYRRCNAEGHTLRAHGYRAHLDWLFVKNVAPACLGDAIIYRAFEDRRRYSDHLPISVTIALGEV